MVNAHMFCAVNVFRKATIYLFRIFAFNIVFFFSIVSCWVHNYTRKLKMIVACMVFSPKISKLKLIVVANWWVLMPVVDFSLFRISYIAGIFIFRNASIARKKVRQLVAVEPNQDHASGRSICLARSKKTAHSVSPMVFNHSAIHMPLSNCPAYTNRRLHVKYAKTKWANTT